MKPSQVVSLLRRVARSIEAGQASRDEVSRRLKYVLAAVEPISFTGQMSATDTHHGLEGVHGEGTITMSGETFPIAFDSTGFEIDGTPVLDEETHNSLVAYFGSLAPKDAGAWECTVRNGKVVKVDSALRSMMQLTQ